VRIMATECKYKEKCFNYPSKCDTCNAMSDLMNHHPCFKNKDVVEVVRCKDCIHYKDEWCEILKAETPIADGFCCYGERKCDND
jgi:hypothetical protein